MKTSQFNAVVVGLILVLVTNVLVSVYGQGYIMSFQVTGFQPATTYPPPTNPVSGSIVWETDGIHSPIKRLVSIDLMVGGHAYTLNEIGHVEFDPWGTSAHMLIGGTIRGVNEIAHLTDDFWMEWDSVTLLPFSFAYSSSQRRGIWDVDIIHNPGCFTYFSITAVPEPSMLSLFALLVAAFCIWYRLGRRFNADA